MTVTFAHIINPVSVGPGSDLFVAQPVTFETMRVARKFSAEQVQVDLFSAQYAEDVSLVPADFTKTENLTHSVLDLSDFREQRKLPLVNDILSRLYETSDAEYFIYTNVDIALMPHFYSAVATLLRGGLDGLVINRRTIPDIYKDKAHIPLMYSMPGEPHGGFDCFVFRREVFPEFLLGDLCVGIGGVGRLLMVNVLVHAKRFSLIGDAHLTFHIGDDMSWKSNRYSDYTDFNTKEARAALEEMDRRYGPFDRSTVPGIYLN